MTRLKNAMPISALTLLMTLAGVSAANESGPRWIWYPENAVSEARDADRFFRVQFDLAENPERADLWVVVDDAGEFWVNEEPLDDPDERRGGCMRFPVARLLRAGTNVLAAKVHNATNVAGLVARLTIAFPAEPERSVVTNGDWKASREAAAGWTGGGFDDSAWVQARDLGDAWAAPWSNYAAYDTAPLVTDAERAARTAALYGRRHLEDAVFEHVSLRLGSHRFSGRGVRPRTDAGNGRQRHHKAHSESSRCLRTETHGNLR